MLRYHPGDIFDSIADIWVKCKNSEVQSIVMKRANIILNEYLAAYIINPTNNLQIVSETFRIKGIETLEKLTAMIKQSNDVTQFIDEQDEINKKYGASTF